MNQTSRDLAWVLPSSLMSSGSRMFPRPAGRLEAGPFSSSRAGTKEDLLEQGPDQHYFQFLPLTRVSIYWIIFIKVFYFQQMTFINKYQGVRTFVHLVLTVYWCQVNSPFEDFFSSIPCVAESMAFLAKQWDHIYFHSLSRISINIFNNCLL